ncbi:hypothetical protein BN000_03596 [Mycobacterium europaeum]|uniref:Acyl-CoA thioesterase-like N-terminal HotDog domain-containing protein n=1 Tax=Mycobacterium europaeum TaxID=761804 RepID=A0A0U1DIB0_9MYCO|nr:acyl-CoA thioesterase domain-containing protein [Mycobacterium europaeum]CQD16855.1 hypothetical protein BN000_03596 [Mycobacterium europaeum]
MTHPFDDAIRLDATGTHVRRGRTHPEWANMVGPFGGITAAAVLHAIESHPDRRGEPLALTVNYAAPIADGGFEISLRAARTNRSNQHWETTSSCAPRTPTASVAATSTRAHRCGHGMACCRRPHQVVHFKG